MENAKKMDLARGEWLFMMSPDGAKYSRFGLWEPLGASGDILVKSGRAWGGFGGPRWSQEEPKMEPRWPQMEPKMEPRREKEEATQQKQGEKRKKQHKRGKKGEGRRNTTEARRTKEAPTRKENKNKILYIQTPDQPLLAAPY